MKEENNIKVLDEVNKGCTMGMDSLKDILNKAEGKTFKETLERHYKKYEKVSEKIKELYANNHITIIGNSCSTEKEKIDRLIYINSNGTIKSCKCTNECNYSHCKLTKIIKIKLDNKNKKYVTRTKIKGVKTHEKLQNKQI